MRLLINTESLARSKKGTTFGLVYFETESGLFPGKGWTDLAPAFARAWLEAMIRIASGSTKTETVWFMDGPYTVEVSATNPGIVEMKFIHSPQKGDIVLHSAKAEIANLLQNAVLVGEQVLADYQQRRWRDNDTEPLEIATKQGAKLLAKLKTRPPV